MPGALDDTFILDLTGPEAALCGLLLAGFGARVLKVDWPGATDRARAPLGADGASLEYFAWNRGKTVVAFDTSDPHAAERLREVAARADFVIESRDPAALEAVGLDYASVSAQHPGVVYVSVSPFGRGGPYGSYRAGDLVIQAAAGHAYHNGPPERPMRLSVESSFAQASVQAAVGAMIAHYHRERTGAGQHVDLSMQEAVAYTLDEHPAAWDILRELHPRHGVGRLVSRASLASTVFECRDGWICSLYYFGLVGSTFETAATLFERFGVDISELRSPEWQAKIAIDFGNPLAPEDEARLIELSNELAGAGHPPRAARGVRCHGRLGRRGVHAGRAARERPPRGPCVLA